MSHETLGAGANGLTVPAFQVRDDHRGLLVGLDRSAAAAGGPVEAGLVAVPATRRRRHALHTAVEVAGDLGWPLLVLCSHGLQPSEVRERVRRIRPDVRVVAATVAQGRRVARTPALALRTALRGRPPHRRRHQPQAQPRSRRRGRDRARAGCSSSTTTSVDLGVRRRARGPGPPARSPRTTSSVSWPLIDFPDNSVVHHARRDYLGRPQTCFVGGGALLVRLAGRVPPGFPPVYNEDWLFLFDALERGSRRARAATSGSCPSTSTAGGRAASRGVR